MIKKVLLLIFLLAVFAGAEEARADANLTLSPASGSYTVGSSIDVSVILDTGAAQSSGADFILDFPADKLEVQLAGDVSYGSSPLFTSNTPARDNANGRITSISTMSVATNTFTGKGTLATIRFKAKAAGTATLQFECSTGSRADTNVWSAGSDIINCTQTTGASYTITVGTSSTNAPSSAPSKTTPPIGAPTGGDTKGGLPNSGAAEVTMALGLGGVVLLILGYFFPRFFRA